ncbi:MAG TPA: VanZ family protein [Longimicrobiaceae bacterium]|nr:VanZ family protein [Longimicrobiaceae bacterium]
MKRFLRAWAPALLYAAVLFVLSAQEALPAPPDIPAFDKLEHLAAYALLGVLLARGGTRWPVATAWVLALGIVYGASDEIHQAFVPGRSPGVGDWLADAAGVVAGVYLYTMWHARRRPPAAVPRGADLQRT